VTTLGVGEIEQHALQILPGGKTLLFSARKSTFNNVQLVVQSLETGQRRVITDGTSARYISPGYLEYVQAGAVYVAAFDLTRLEITGSPVLALQGVRMTSNFSAHIAYSQAGSMIYVPGAGDGGRDTLVWVNRSGVEEPTTVSAGAGAIRAPRLAPDLRRVAVLLTADRGLVGNQQDVWLYDLIRNTSSRLTFDGASSFSVWSPDGTRLAYNSRQSEILVKTLGSTSQDKRLETDRDTNYPFSWSPDGKFIAGVSVNRTGGRIRVFGVDDPSASKALGQIERAGGPAFSHDGRWIAYSSLKSGRNEVYMRPFPGLGEEWTISTEGGNEPVWARKTGQLFYRHGDAMMVVDITTTPTPVVGMPRKVFERKYNASDAFWPNYDVSPDGQRFLMVKSSPPSPATRVNVVLDWSEELKRLVPAK
jgi:Tol biopolymer transport system component